MTSRLDAIKARAEAASHANHTTTMNYNAVYSVVWRSHQDIPALVAAVEAVLELHEEVGNEGKPGCDCGCLGLVPWCKCGDYTYPCPTVVAIQSALRDVGK